MIVLESFEEPKELSKVLKVRFSDDHTPRLTRRKTTFSVMKVVFTQEPHVHAVLK